MDVLKGSRFFVCAPSDLTKSGSSLCVSLEVGLAGATTPIPPIQDIVEENAPKSDDTQEKVKRD